MKGPEVQGHKLRTGQGQGGHAGASWATVWSWGTRVTPGSSRKRCPGMGQMTSLQKNGTKHGPVGERLPAQGMRPDLSSGMCVS